MAAWTHLFLMSDLGKSLLDSFALCLRKFPQNFSKKLKSFFKLKKVQKAFLRRAEHSAERGIETNKAKVNQHWNNFCLSSAHCGFVEIFIDFFLLLALPPTVKKKRMLWQKKADNEAKNRASEAAIKTFMLRAESIWFLCCDTETSALLVYVSTLPVGFCRCWGCRFDVE